MNRTRNARRNIRRNDDSFTAVNAIDSTVKMQMWCGFFEVILGVIVSILR